MEHRILRLEDLAVVIFITMLIFNALALMFILVWQLLTNGSGLSPASLLCSRLGPSTSVEWEQFPYRSAP